MTIAPSPIPAARRRQAARRGALSRMGWRGWLKVALVVVPAGSLAGLGLAWRPALDPIQPPPPGRFAPQQVARGAVLARLGDCAVCHTGEGGRPLAGGRALPTPFGTLYSTNLTPDPQTGIGTWSALAFRRAMKDGVRRDGAHLYPALPYEHFTHVSDADLDALYAYLMTRPAVQATAPANRLIFPLGFRPLLAGWKLLFLHHGATPADPRRSAEWNRGAYLAEGLGHCGACHTPRNWAGGEIGARAYDGGVAEGWRAPPLGASNPAARRWTPDALTAYLRTGISPDHSAAGGPMGPVVESLSHVPESDVRAIAVYIATRMGNADGGRHLPPTDHALAALDRFPQGAVLFAGACAGCHGAGAPMLGQNRPSLALASALRDSDPASAVQAVLQGIAPPVAGRGPKMPGFANSLTNKQTAAVLAYARARYTDAPAWKALPAAVAKARQESAQP